MAGRALVFSNSEVIRQLKTRYVPYAGDQWYLHRQQDADGAFFWKVVDQGYRKEAPKDETRQGLYVATANGDLLASDCFRPSPESFLDLLKTARTRWERHPTTELRIAADGADDPQYHRTPPEGGLVLDVFTRIPMRTQLGRWTPNQATGRDHLWLTRAEVRALLPQTWKTGARYPVTPKVAERLIRFHLVDNVRGEPDMWRPDQVREANLALVVEDATTHRLRLEGMARMQFADRRGLDARIQGYFTYNPQQQRFTQADLLAWGEAWGSGTYTGDPPPGKFPLVIAFSLAGDRGADRVPPQGSRNWSEYFGH